MSNSPMAYYEISQNGFFSLDKALILKLSIGIGFFSVAICGFITNAIRKSKKGKTEKIRNENKS
jgi:hypothetical protein